MVVLSVLKNGSILASPGITVLKATGDKVTKSVQAPLPQKQESRFGD